MLFGHQDNARPANASSDTGARSNDMTMKFAGKAPNIDPSGTEGLPSIPDNFDAGSPTDTDVPSSALNQGTSTPPPTVFAPQAQPIDIPQDTTADSTNVVTDEPKEALPASAPSQPVEPRPADAKPFDADLLALKQQALAQLQPLVDHLDQTPEEKFRTTMMLIQGSDNQALIKTAYEAAQQITDEKVKAQALLDIVNEINYFAQKEKTD